MTAQEELLRRSVSPTNRAIRVAPAKRKVNVPGSGVEMGGTGGITGGITGGWPEVFGVMGGTPGGSSGGKIGGAGALEAAIGP